ncbi:MAG: protein kinase, partial [Deltaproteobacteria bacterium]|nr:protein kinase [Deltaproteobacteria bacterium]
MPVRAFLGALRLEQYVPLFEANDIDAELLDGLSDADLTTIGVASLGHRKRILAAIAIRRGDAGATLTAPRASIEVGREEARPEGHVLQGELGQAIAARGYELRDRVGQGGMGEVFLARQASVGRDVAVKVLRARSGADDRARFTREARAIAALRHPNVVHLYDYVLAEDGGACIVMEHVSGGSLGELFAREGRLPLARVVPLAVQICDALAEAHGKGIVHRDLKPANVLVTRVEGYGDFVKVLDFGIAHWRGEEGGGQDRLTQTGMIYGTPRYLSPEQILGTGIGPRSDLYALGVVLFEALAGETPFGGSMDAALLFKHLKEAPPPLPVDVIRPPALDDLLARLLAKSPSLRPPSAVALRKELLALLPTHVTAVTRPTLTPSGAVAERRRVVVLDVSFVERSRLASAPDVAHTIARRCQTVIDGIVRRHAGTVTSRTATGVQIVFGAPIARNDDLARALEAALALPVALVAVDPDVVEVRVGVAEGAAVSGALREGVEGGLFVSGAPVAEAEDLRALAGAGEVRVSRAVSRSAPPGIAFALAADGASAVASRLERTTAREQPFVGREREQAQ